MGGVEAEDVERHGWIVTRGCCVLVGRSMKGKRLIDSLL